MKLPVCALSYRKCIIDFQKGGQSFEELGNECQIWNCSIVFLSAVSCPLFLTNGLMIVTFRDIDMQASSSDRLNSTDRYGNSNDAQFFLSPTLDQGLISSACLEQLLSGPRAVGWNMLKLSSGLLAYSVSGAPSVSFRIWLILSVKNLEKSSACKASSADGAASSSLH